MSRAAVIAVVVAASVAFAGQRRGDATTIAATATCAADLGAGASSKRRFCDVVIAASASDSIVVDVPAHAGRATLLFDLHNRFTLPVATASPVEAFARHSAQVAVVGADGAIIHRAVVTREFRSAQDLFDQIAGGGRAGGMKGVGPGQPVPVAVELPAGIRSAGIVGVRLEEVTLGTTDAYDAPGRAIAIVSNLRLQYVPK
jgi:hypothetical protein